jgi:AraC-like DNA-binding protein
MDLLWDGRDVVIAGPDTYAHVFRSDPGSSLIGLRFAPGFAPRVLGAPADAFTNQQVPLDAVWAPDEVRRVTDLLAASPDPARTLEDVALRRDAASDDETAALIDHVVALAGAGCTSATIADRVGYSSRQLQRRSRAAFGYGTKTLHRILRMQRALDLIRRGARTADSAARAGYADQPHLAREIRDIAGVPLTALMA